jgi:TetR/AcrR family transcriptional regulator, regulator of autoinduction and epiphytic fitness
MPKSAEPPLSIDGRTARRERNRTAVLDATLELLADGFDEPTPDQVAARAGVSVRSVYRYTENRQDLFRASTERAFERFRPLFEVDGLGVGPFEDRVTALVSTRVRALDATRVFARLAERLRQSHPDLEASIRDARRLARRQIELQFAAELRVLDPERRRCALDTIDTMLAPEAYGYLRDTLGRSPDEIIDLVERLVASLVA